MKYRFVFLLIGCLLSISSFSQQSDTLTINDSLRHSPTKATLFSLVVPGLGQAYNKKYWKVPLAWAAIGTPLYFAIDQQSKFNDFKRAYIRRVDNNPFTEDLKYDSLYTDAQLLGLVNFHRENRDLFYILTAVGYALNILDAAVDAHLFYFDVSDEIGMNIQPNFTSPFAQGGMAAGFKLSFRLKDNYRNRRL